MALKWFEGFERRKNSTALAQAYSQLTFGDSTFQTGRLQGSSLRNLGTTGLTVTTPAFTAQQVWIVGLAYRRDDTDVTNKSVISMFDGASNRQIDVATFVSAGKLKFQVWTDSSGGSSSWTASGEFELGQWYYVEFKATIAPGTSGSFELRVNSTTALTQSSVNTANAATTQADRVRFLCTGSASNGISLDDIYVCDNQGAIRNDFLGDVVIEGLSPTAEGATIQWTPLTGTDNSAMVDDTDGPDGDDSYVSTAANGITDTHVFEDLGFITGNVLGVMVAYNARILSSGSRTLKAIARTGGTDFEGANNVLGSTGYVELNHIFEQNPNTTADWTVSDINGAEFGYKAVA